jgi:hypothetical protein
VKEVPVTLVSTTNIFVARSLTPNPYKVAPFDALQLSITLLLAVVGPGLVVDPGLVLVGMAGKLTAPGVWKYKGVVKLEQPALLQALTFHRYCLPAVKLAV